MNYQEFCQALENLLADPEFPIDNKKTVEFLEAMIAWLESTRGGGTFFNDKRPDSIAWADLLELLQAAAIYE